MLKSLGLMVVICAAVTAVSEEAIPLYLRPPRIPSIALLTPNALFYSGSPETAGCAGKGVYRVGVDGEETPVDANACVISLESYLDGVVITKVANNSPTFSFWDDKKRALAPSMDTWLPELPDIRSQLASLLWARGDEELNGQGKVAAQTPVHRLFFRKGKQGTSLMLTYRAGNISALAKSELPFKDENSVALHPSLKMGGGNAGDLIPVGDDFRAISGQGAGRDFAVLENGNYFVLRNDAIRPEVNNSLLEGDVNAKELKASALDAKDLLAVSPGPNNSLIVSRSLGIFLHPRGGKAPEFPTIGKSKRMTGACGNLAVIQAGEGNYDIIYRQEIEATREWESLKLGSFSHTGEWICRDNELVALAKQFVPYLRAGHLTLDLVVADTKNKKQTNDPSAIAVFANRNNLAPYLLPAATLAGRTLPIIGDASGEARLFVVKEKSLRLVRLPPPRRSFRSVKDIAAGKPLAVEVTLFDQGNNRENGYRLIIENAGWKMTPQFTDAATAGKESP